MAIKQTIFMLLLALATKFALQAQTAGYNTDRRSFTIIYVEEPKNAGPYFRQGVPYEFRNSLFWNDIKTRSIRTSETNLESIGQQLTNQGIGNQIMALWWNRQPDGSFRLDTVAARGRYNALDLSRQIVDNGPRGLAELEDAGLKLVAESYVLVVRPKSLRTMREEYDLQDQITRQTGGTKMAERTERGYTGQAEGYLYKLVYDAKAKSDFYDMWIYDTDSPEVKKQKIEAFDQYRFQLQPVNMVTAKGAFGDIRATTSTKTAAGATQKTDAQLLEDWAETAIGKLFEAVVGKTIGENTYPVWGNSPVISKIGLKEGVFPDKRFVVYERREHADGSISKHKRATVRARRVTDNRRETTGNTTPSTFYRVGGLGAVQPGMLLEPRREAGIGIHALYSPGLPGTPELLEDYGLGIETNLSLWLGKIGWNAVPVGLKLGVNYTLMTDSLYVNTNTPVKANVSRLAVYLRKDFHFLSILRFGIWAGYGIDTVEKSTKKESDTKQSLSSSIVPMGAELGFNLFGPLQAFGQAEYALPIGDVSQNDKTNSSLPEWYTLYPDREGVALRAGLRFNF